MCRQRIAQAGALAAHLAGTPTDNAQAEAGWWTLKTELLPGGGVFASLEEARLKVACYLDTYFNLDRRHSALGYRSPHHFKADLLHHLPLSATTRPPQVVTPLHVSPSSRSFAFRLKI